MNERTRRVEARVGHCGVTTPSVLEDTTPLREGTISLFVQHVMGHKEHRTKFSCHSGQVKEVFPELKVVRFVFNDMGT